MTPSSALRKETHRLCERLYPNHRGGQIVVKPSTGGSVRITFPASVGSDQLSGYTPSKMQEAILEVLKRAAGEDPITGEDLAKAAGYEATGGAWRKALAGLIASGQITNCRPGYMIRNEA